MVGESINTESIGRRTGGSGRHQPYHALYGVNPIMVPSSKLCPSYKLSSLASFHFSKKQSYSPIFYSLILKSEAHQSIERLFESKQLAEITSIC
jgi:hypothetical protein